MWPFTSLPLCRVIWCTRALRCRRCFAIGKSARLELHFLADGREDKLKQDNASRHGDCLPQSQQPSRPFGPAGPSPAIHRSVAWLAQGTHRDGILSQNIGERLLGFPQASQTGSLHHVTRALWVHGFAVIGPCRPLGLPLWCRGALFAAAASGDHPALLSHSILIPCEPESGKTSRGIPATDC